MCAVTDGDGSTVARGPVMHPTARAVSSLGFLAAALAGPAAVAASGDPPPVRPEPGELDPAALVGKPCRDEEAVPWGYRCGRSDDFRGLLGAGIGVAVMGDVITILTMALNRGADPYAFIPIAGSFAAAAAHKRPVPPSSEGFSFNFDMSPVGYIAGGIVQSVGAALILGSIAWRKPVLLTRKQAVTLLPVPLVSKTAAGLGLGGTF